jgi:hypothetical protein
MNTDIRISVSFKDHRKRKKLRLLIGECATDYLIDLWISTAMNHPSGVLDGMDEFDIALESGWVKDPFIYTEGLVKAGFLDRSESGVFSLHDWEEHQGYVVHAKERSMKAKKAAEERWKKNEKNATSMEKDARSMLQACRSMLHACRSDAPAPAPAPAPVPAPVPKQKKKIKEYNPEKENPDFIPEDLWLSLLENRRFKKLQNSKLALTTICNSFQKAVDSGYTIEAVISTYVSGKMQTFNVEWMKESPSGKPIKQDCKICHYRINHNCQKEKKGCTAFKIIAN